ncbi:H-NS histone family protein [Ketogulonicigenium vulgare]|uniref:Histone-like protein protein of HNS family protein n=1 Tax=Ketogulonicigenium vulgare (strain WSH-001) TaxID=759362 RepID=F9Y9Q6_KETVW|nr:H-NS histone family protein [Ketogulonicigenium vulgare]AEM41394.1 Histone-like protein protein of HNS family protein [Ketogulonicigenium vulgare WSH-001]ALJ81528.1 nucleoid-structuring protein H-NS [Ketogulonicigenium vulgare]ANW34229.1 nucleoid-structuring protein H-NS [Ketogulonicigenium vulgare]
MDLDSLDRRELVQLLVEIDQALVSVDDRNRKCALRAAEHAVSRFGLSLNQLADDIRSMKEVTPRGVARYRNPSNPAQTWSGRGRRPTWVHELGLKGLTLDDCAL